MNRLVVKSCFMAISCIWLLSSCGTSKSVSKYPPIPETLGVYLVNNSGLDSVDFFQYQERTIAFIDSFNNENPPFTLYYSNTDSSALVLTLERFKFSSGLRMASGPIITGLGIATLVFTLTSPVGVVIVFWYMPKNHTEAIVYFSSDIDPQVRKNRYAFSSNHGFYKLARQKQRHLNSYDLFMRQINNGLLREVKSGKRQVVRNSGGFDYFNSP